MHLLNFSVDRIIIHQIYQRDPDSNIVPPTQSRAYIRFDDSAMESFKDRVRDSLGTDSKAVQMEIVHQDLSDLPNLIDKMIDQDDENFAPSSFDIAVKLSKAQHRRDLKGGIVVVFTGHQGAPPKKFFGIIKAEIYSAYQKIINPITGEISLDFVKEALLTPTQKLYKTAGFFEKSEYNSAIPDLNDKWAVLVSDHQMNKIDGKAAAQYFYQGFLGCGYPQTSARTTKQFYDSTVTFISKLDVPPEKKGELLTALNTYLKVETSSTASASEFGSRYLDTETQDIYKEHISDSGLPETAFTKDIEHIKSNLRERKVKFNSKVKITGPSDAFEKLIKFKTVTGDPDESGEPAEWTEVLIKDRIINQE